MPNSLTQVSPLMQPVQWHGEKFTTQYFHTQYQQQMTKEGPPENIGRFKPLFARAHCGQWHHIARVPWSCPTCATTYFEEAV